MKKISGKITGKVNSMVVVSTCNTIPKSVFDEKLRQWYSAHEQYSHIMLQVHKEVTGRFPSIRRSWVKSNI